MLSIVFMKICGYITIEKYTMFTLKDDTSFTKKYHVSDIITITSLIFHFHDGNCTKNFFKVKISILEISHECIHYKTQDRF